MPWESIGSVGNGQMPSDRDWILLCNDIAITYLKFTCGSPPEGCQIETMWHAHDLGDYPTIGISFDFHPPWDYIQRCQMALERFDDAVAWSEIDPDSYVGEEQEEEDNLATSTAFNVDDEVNRYIDELSIPKKMPPVAVVIMGGLAAGKTTLRKHEFAKGYVLVDAADIFVNLCNDEILPFPGDLQQSMNLVGLSLAKRVVCERRNLVTEILGTEYESTKQLITALKRAGYCVNAAHVKCDIEEAVRRNADRSRGEISSVYSESFNRSWLIEACNEFAESDGESGLESK